MISVQEATDILLQHSLALAVEEVPLTAAIGRILREDLFADRPFPPYDRVTMDGIAILYETYAKGNRSFPIEKVIAAGDPEGILENPAHCVENSRRHAVWCLRGWLPDA
jgi:molybdopterin molybdotransferase